MSAEVIAVGSIYAEFTLDNFPFKGKIEAEDRLVGGKYLAIAGSSALYFSKMCKTLGLSAAFIGKAGKGPVGNFLDGLLEESGIVSALAKSPDVQTNVGINLINSQGETITMVAGDANPSLSRDDVLLKLRPLLPEAEYLYFGGCFRMKGLIPHYCEIAEEAHQQNVLVAMDHGPVNANASEAEINGIRKAVSAMDFYFPSRKEFLQTWGVTTIEEGLKKSNDYSPALVVLKDKENGAITYQDGQIIRVPAFPVAKIVNPVGGGDSFNAAVIYAHSQGMDPIQSIRFGCATAALRISQATPPSLENIYEKYRS